MNKSFYMLALLFSGLLSMVACNSSSNNLTATSTARPQVVATSWTAELIGELVNIDHCIRVNDIDSDASYLLIWPPDITAIIEIDTIQVVTGAITGNREKVILHIGEMVRLSGGETEKLNEQLMQTLPENCPGPYWVVGLEVGPLEPK